MKIGYSILMGEMFPAAEVEHGDCEQFQIVCPECREPVFKAVRGATAETDTIHYLAHYGALKAYQKECELRVGTLSKSDHSHQNTEARNQRLEYFLGVMRSVLGRDPIYSSGWEKTHYRLNKSTGLDTIFLTVTELVKQQDPSGVFDECAIDYMYQLEASGWKTKTTFSQGVQMRIARDMWSTIATPITRTNLRWLMNHAWVHGLNGWLVRPSDESEEDRAVSRLMADSMIAISNATGKGSLELLQQLGSTFLPQSYNNIRGKEDSERSDVLCRIQGNLVIEMVGILLTMPYSEMLKEMYGDSSKVYAQPEGTVPATDEAAALLKSGMEMVDGRPLPTKPKAH